MTLQRRRIYCSPSRSTLPLNFNRMTKLRMILNCVYCFWFCPRRRVLKATNNTFINYIFNAPNICTVEGTRRVPSLLQIHCFVDSGTPTEQATRVDCLWCSLLVFCDLYQVVRLECLWCVCVTFFLRLCWYIHYGDRGRGNLIHWLSDSLSI